MAGALSVSRQLVGTQVPFWHWITLTRPLSGSVIVRRVPCGELPQGRWNIASTARIDLEAGVRCRRSAPLVDVRAGRTGAGERQTRRRQQGHDPGP